MVFVFFVFFSTEDPQSRGPRVSGSAFLASSDCEDTRRGSSGTEDSKGRLALHQLRNKRSLEKRKKDEIKLYHAGGVLPYHYPRDNNQCNNRILSA